jgi:hypothetical protein
MKSPLTDNQRGFLQEKGRKSDLPSKNLYNVRRSGTMTIQNNKEEISMNNFIIFIKYDVSLYRI